jgi:probable biosynthetic protein (TIGR04098 family)
MLGVSGLTSERMRDEAGNQIYPTFVAIRARYEQPLNAVEMDDRFLTTVDIVRCGRNLFHSTVSFGNRALRFSLEMLTSFVTRNQNGRNELRRLPTASDIISQASPFRTPPALLKLSQAIRHREIDEYDFLGHPLPLQGSDLDHSIAYQPSPYTDYNGAGLLYFAAYPTITDTLERQLVKRERLVAGDHDWARLTSTVARDVYYYRNLDLGKGLTANLKRFDRVGGNFVVHTLLVSEDGAPLADVITAKKVVADHRSKS